MHTSFLIRDIAILLLAAGIAGVICRRIGLSVIVGYLLAGIIIGPNMPMKLIDNEARIEDLAQVGLVFVMFAIGLHLSVTKLAKMGIATIMATVLGAAFMFAFTLLLGGVMGWDQKQSLFIAGMLMVSSSAVIAKIMEELHLTHNKTAQMVLAVTIVEDIVAVVMVTVLATVSAVNATAAAVSQASSGGIGAIFGHISSYVVLIMAACILFLPKILKKLDASEDPELRTIVVAGVLLILAFCAQRAGFSPALGAFLFGAIIAEMPQKGLIEKSFDSVRALFSSIFFVSIGMIAKPADLLENWWVVLILVCFVMFIRPIACGFALMLVGVAPREARRGGMLLTPLGEFTFIIAQQAIAAAILPDYFYPVAIALSVFTVLLTPVLNRFADPIIGLMEKLEPPFVTRAIVAYHDWLRQLKNRSPSGKIWPLIKSNVYQIIGEMLLITGLLVFSPMVLEGISEHLFPSRVGLQFDWLTVGGPFWYEGSDFTSTVALWFDWQTVCGPLWREGPDFATAATSWFDWLTVEKPSATLWFNWLTAERVDYVFWGLLTMVVLVPLFAVWRTLSAVSLILAEFLKNRFLPQTLLERAFQLASSLGLVFWLCALLPVKFEGGVMGWLLSGVGLGVLGGVIIAVAIFSKELIHWHSAWQNTVREVLSNKNDTDDDAELDVSREMFGGGLEAWNIHLQDCVIPDRTVHRGITLHELAIPARFGVTIIEIERNRHPIMPRPEVRLYAGDKLLLLGENEKLAKAHEFLRTKTELLEGADALNQAVLETCIVKESVRAGKTLAELEIPKNTGVRIVGIQRDDRKIINPTGAEILRNDDDVLLVGTLAQIHGFRKWLAESAETSGEIANDAG